MAFKGRNTRGYLPFLLGLWLAVVFVPLLPDKAAAQTFTSGEWEGIRLLDQAGNFAGCWINKMYEGGTRLGIAISPEGDLELWLINEEWTYLAGEQFDVHFAVDDGEKQPAPALAQIPEAIGIAISAAQRGSRLEDQTRIRARARRSSPDA